MTATVIPWEVFKDAWQKKHDPKTYNARKMYDAIGQQVRANEAAKPLLIGKSPEPIEPDFDDIPVMDRGDMAILWGIGDPGDEG